MFLGAQKYINFPISEVTGKSMEKYRIKKRDFHKSLPSYIYKLRKNNQMNNIFFGF